MEAVCCDASILGSPTEVIGQAPYTHSMRLFYYSLVHAVSAPAFTQVFEAEPRNLAASVKSESPWQRTLPCRQDLGFVEQRGVRVIWNPYKHYIPFTTGGPRVYLHRTKSLLFEWRLASQLRTLLERIETTFLLS